MHGFCSRTNKHLGQIVCQYGLSQNLYTFLEVVPISKHECMHVAPQIIQSSKRAGAYAEAHAWGPGEAHAHHEHLGEDQTYC